MPTYTIRAYRSQSTVPDGYDYSTEASTLKEAKRTARYVLTEDFQRSGEMSQPFRYATVAKQFGEIVFDCFAK